MRVLGIDPGNEQSAWLLYDHGRITTFGINTNDVLLHNILRSFREEPDIQMVLEQVASFGMPVGKEVFETVFWSGRFAQEWQRPFHRVTRGEVKMHLCNSMRAKDGNIRQALLDKLGPQGTKKAPGPTYGISKDVWSALAVAVTWAEKSDRSAKD